MSLCLVTGPLSNLAEWDQCENPAQQGLGVEKPQPHHLSTTYMTYNAQFCCTAGSVKVPGSWVSLDMNRYKRMHLDDQWRDPKTWYPSNIPFNLTSAYCPDLKSSISVPDSLRDQCYRKISALQTRFRCDWRSAIQAILDSIHTLLIIQSCYLLMSWSSQRQARMIVVFDRHLQYGPRVTSACS